MPITDLEIGTTHHHGKPASLTLQTFHGFLQFLLVLKLDTGATHEQTPLLLGRVHFLPFRVWNIDNCGGRGKHLDVGFGRVVDGGNGSVPGDGLGITTHSLL
ncbi:Uncharacterized protein TCM_031731 [Theobroma cacao]|uniref:Uncharacterized protein n=1 Tax=Theobroma cacao TaxID=3641 RepID=A0A061F7A4_THECC|nr:Uncharacterized protein TCM_031731 [Theobroma cacao]